MATFCGVSSVEGARANAGFWQWPLGHRLTWSVRSDIRVTGFTKNDIADIFSETWKLWDAVSGISIQFTASPADANVLILSRAIDGAKNVLAEAELPPPGIQPTAQLRLWLDEGEKWVNALNAPPNAIDVFRVGLHEGGHSLGLGHQNDGSIPAIMAPFIGQIRSLQPSDVKEIQLRYGLEKPPAPVPPPGGGGDGSDDFADLLEQISKCLRTLTPESKRLVRELLRDV